jgi:hypothetical protein
VVVRALLALVAAAAVTSPDVAKLILRPSQVGTGYVLLHRKDGRGVKNTVTLDLCGRSGYRSERLRTTRLQVNYLKQKSGIGLSNEVVVYRPGGAAEAMREVIGHANRCPSTPIKADPTLPPLRFTITRIKDSRLLKGYLAVKVRVRGTVQGTFFDQTSYAVYQRLGDVLSGTYSFGPDTQAQLRFALHAAEQSAQNLRRGHNVDSPTA